MTRYRRAVLLGSPIIAAALAVAIAAWARQDVGARPAPGLRQAIACDARPVPAETRGAWWRTHQELDASGALTGWRVAFGIPGRGDAEILAPAETSVAGPFRGIVVVATDDGTRSIVDLISPGGGCAWAAFETDAVVRRAILDPSGAHLVVHLVDRKTRADRGISAIDERGVSQPLIPPLDDALRAAVGIDRVWATDLRFAADGRRLAVQSCGETLCVTRVAALQAAGSGDAGGRLLVGAIQVLAERQGAMIGLSADTLVAWSACPGLPCDLLAIPLDGRAGRVLVAGAVGAGLTRSGRIVATTVADGQDADVAVDLGSGRRLPISGSNGRLRPLSEGPSAGSGLEVGPDDVAVEDRSGAPLPLAVPEEVRP